MSYKIFAIRNDGNHEAIPMKDEKAIGQEFDTREDAHEAFRMADDLQIPSLCRSMMMTGSYKKFPKKSSAMSYTILEVL